ncbi:MAG: SusF/SusE family outer membrane protein [Muribaculaceae bacterium]|nr:SusF/SusE family outer membrane protein [Muribaculaceae bacterium]
MKTSYKYLAALMLPFMASCDSDDVQYHIETPEDQMHITASVEELVLTAETVDDEVLTFNWNPPMERGENAKITTYFRMGVADNNFEESTGLIEMAPDQTSISFTCDDLNDYLMEWGISPETTVSVEAQLIASVTDTTLYKKPELSSTRLLMTGFRPVSRPLWIVNPAMAEGSDAQTNEVVLGKQYTWFGMFDKEVGVKFIYNRETQLPSLNKGADDNTIVRRDNASDPDNLLHCPKTGVYTVTVSTKTMTCKWDFYLPPYDKVYMVGNATPAGWNIDDPVPMIHDEENPELFYWEGRLEAGEMKLPLAAGKGWGCDYFMPPVHGTDWDGDDTVVVIPGGNPDNKWVISRPGNYRVEVNINLMKIKFMPLD